MSESINVELVSYFIDSEVNSLLGTSFLKPYALHRAVSFQQRTAFAVEHDNAHIKTLATLAIPTLSTFLSDSFPVGPSLLRCCQDIPSRCTIYKLSRSRLRSSDITLFSLGTELIRSRHRPGSKNKMSTFELF